MDRPWCGPYSTCANERHRRRQHPGLRKQSRRSCPPASPAPAHAPGRWTRSLVFVLAGSAGLPTHRYALRDPPKPLSARDATANAQALLRRPHVRTPGEGDGFWELFRQTGRDLARGNDVPDAHLITLMRQHGVRRIYSRDVGLRRYADLDVVDPFAPAGGGRRSPRSAT